MPKCAANMKHKRPHEDNDITAVPLRRFVDRTVFSLQVVLNMCGLRMLDGKNELKSSVAKSIVTALVSLKLLLCEFNCFQSVQSVDYSNYVT